MRLVLDKALFEHPGVDGLSLLQLIGACRRPSPHFVVLRPNWDPAVDRWLAQWPERVRGDLTTILRDTVENARRGRALTLVVQAPGAQRERARSDAPRLSVETALAMVREPLRVLVENRRNDGRFLARFAVAVPDEARAQFREALKHGWITFEQGGGLPEVKHLLDDLDAPSSDPVLCPQGNRREVRRWRLVVVVDRDAFEPKRPRTPRAAGTPPPRDPTRPSQASTDARLRAEQLLPAWQGRQGVHQLQRRAIENYIPLRTMRAWIDEAKSRAVADRRRESVAALARLDAPNAEGLRPRWFFGMKDGLEGDKPAGLKPSPVADAHIHPIFHALTTPERLALNSGFTTRKESIADLHFDPQMAPDEWLREELLRDESAEAQGVIHNLLNRM